MDIIVFRITANRLRNHNIRSNLRCALGIALGCGPVPNLEIVCRRSEWLTFVEGVANHTPPERLGYIEPSDSCLILPYYRIPPASEKDWRDTYAFFINTLKRPMEIEAKGFTEEIDENGHRYFKPSKEAYNATDYNRT